MSEPTYRITTERVVAQYNPWEARVARISDGEMLITGYGDTEREAIEAALGMLRPKDENPGAVYFADEDGNLMDTPRPSTVKCHKCNGFGKVKDPLYKDAITCGLCNGSGDEANPAPLMDAHSVKV